jgi:hypothetical protein
MTADEIFAPDLNKNQTVGFGPVESIWWAAYPVDPFHQPHLDPQAALSFTPPVVSGTVFVPPAAAVVAPWQAPNYQSIYTPRLDALASLLFRAPPPDVSQLAQLPPIAFKWYAYDSSGHFVPGLSALAALLAPPPPIVVGPGPVRPPKPPHSIINWRDEVIKEWGDEWGKREIGYEWSNGRKFDDGKGPYEDN